MIYYYCSNELLFFVLIVLIFNFYFLRTLRSLPYVSGTFPTEFGALTATKAFAVSNIPKVTGSLPSQFGALSRFAQL